MKLIHTHPEKVILSAVKKYVEYIAPTFGPAGKKILIVNNEFNHEAVDDGKRASQAFEIENEFENAVVQYIKETTQKGIDGTTTAGLIMGNIILEAFKDLDDELKTHDFHGLALELRKGLDEALKKIKGKPVKTKEELYAIAHNSYNNDFIAELIADTVFKIGKDGVMAIEDSQTTSTTCEIVQGLEVSKGYASPYLINNEDRTKVIVKSPVVILVNKRIETFNELVPLLKQLPENYPVAIFADGFGDGLLNTIIARRFMSNGNFSPLLVELPTGDKLDLLRDIAIITGGKVIDKDLTLDKATPDDLGRASSVEASKDKTKILGGAGKKSDLTVYVNNLKSLELPNVHENEKRNKRVAQLLGGIAVIKLGAYTDNELKGMKTKVENAVKSTQLAFKSGVVAGAGKTLAEIKTSSPLLNEALKAPRKQLEANGAKYLDENVVDPTEVVIVALTTAVSIAEGLLTMGGISVPKRKKDKDNNFE